MVVLDAGVELVLEIVIEAGVEVVVLTQSKREASLV